jgi:L-iditol 2-dehydrogenase
MMKALMWTGPRALEMQTVAAPSADGAAMVVIDVRAVGICGSELSGYLGHNSLRVPPLIMGHEASGVIRHVGAGSLLADGSTARVGQAVTFNPLIACGACAYCVRGRENLCPNRKLIGAHLPGAFAEHVALPARLCYLLPSGMDFVSGSLAEPLACAIRAIATAQLMPDAALAILGAGPIGLFCLRVAKAQGVARVMVTDVDARRLALATAWGADRAVNGRDDDVIKAAKSLAQYGPVAVIDAVGSDVTRQQAIAAVQPGGRVVLIGLHAEHSPLAANYVIRQEINVAGTFGYTNNNFVAAVAMLARNEVPISDEWLNQRPLQEGQRSFEELIDSRSSYAKIVLIP